jgi:hypothetical protein
MCGTVPKLMEDSQFEQCHKGPKGMKGKKGMKMQEGGKGSSEEEGPRGMNKMRRGGDEAGEARPDSVNGEGQMEAGPRSGKRGGKKSRTQREAHKNSNFQ